MLTDNGMKFIQDMYKEKYNKTLCYAYNHKLEEWMVWEYEEK